MLKSIEKSGIIFFPKWQKEAFSPAVRRIKRKRRYMDGIYEFLSAALPWIAMGFLVAILAAKSAARKNKKESDREEDYGTE